MMSKSLVNWTLLRRLRKLSSSIFSILLDSMIFYSSISSSSFTNWSKLAYGLYFNSISAWRVNSFNVSPDNYCTNSLCSFPFAQIQKTTHEVRVQVQECLQIKYQLIHCLQYSLSFHYCWLTDYRAHQIAQYLLVVLLQWLLLWLARFTHTMTLRSLLWFKCSVHRSYNKYKQLN